MRSVRAVTHIMDWDWWPHQLQPRHPASKKSYQSGQVAQKISRSETGQTSQASHKNQIKMDHGKHICWILYDFVGYIFHLQQLLVSTPISKTPMPAPPESSLASLEASSNYWSMMTWWNSCEDSHVNTSWWRVSSKTTECHQADQKIPWGATIQSVWRSESTSSPPKSISMEQILKASKLPKQREQPIHVASLL